MRCKNCDYLTYDYSENYEDCLLGIPDEECTEYNGMLGCKYTQKQLDKSYEELTQAEAESYADMGRWFEEQEKNGWKCLDEDSKQPETTLYNANPNCKHNIVDAPGGGIKCTKCGGWFCY